LREKKRMVLETEKFASFVPYAAAAPFLVWIFPKVHMASFGDMDDSETKDLALNLKTVLGKLYRALANPDFNYTIRSAPIRDKNSDYFHWFMNIVPRISEPAGFELGSGIFINVSLPEECAEFLRKTDV
jgi:UDPglucose--hexose-1-phosphate uridylyltransferase